MRKKRGQSILEYTLLITAVAVAVIYGAKTIISDKTKANMDTAGKIFNMSNTALENATGVQ